MSGTPTVALSVDRLSIRFGGVTAVESMTFDVQEGELLSLIGPNGAGKTSAFNAITGYLPAASGDIVYRGARLNGLKPSRVAALGVVRTFQKTSVFAGRSVLDNILIGLHLQSRQHPLAIMLGLPSVAREERRLVEKAREVLHFVGIEFAQGRACFLLGLWRVATARSRGGAGCRTDAASTGRAGGGHECG